MLEHFSTVLIEFIGMAYLVINVKFFVGLLKYNTVFFSFNKGLENMWCTAFKFLSVNNVIC